MKTSRRKLGDLGEDLACEYLAAAGHEILHRNLNVGHLEIDIISRDSKGLHFVEVKSRTAPLTADPEDSATVAKMSRIANAALGFLADFKGCSEVFFDLVTVVFEGDGAKVSYYPQVYWPIYV